MIEMINADYGGRGHIRVNWLAQLLVLNGRLENNISKYANLFNEKIAGI